MNQISFTLWTLSHTTARLIRLCILQVTLGIYYINFIEIRSHVDMRTSQMRELFDIFSPVCFSDGYCRGISYFIDFSRTNGISEITGFFKNLQIPYLRLRHSNIIPIESRLRLSEKANLIIYQMYLLFFSWQLNSGQKKM